MGNSKARGRRESGAFSAVGQAKAGSHLRVEEAAAGAVGLDPFAIDYELRNSPFANMGEDFFGGAGGVLDVDFGVGDLVGLEEALGLTTITTPGS